MADLKQGLLYQINYMRNEAIKSRHHADMFDAKVTGLEIALDLIEKAEAKKPVWEDQRPIWSRRAEVLQIIRNAIVTTSSINCCLQLKELLKADKEHQYADHILRERFDAIMEATKTENGT